jgi:hypothetical protein
LPFPHLCSDHWVCLKDWTLPHALNQCLCMLGKHSITGQCPQSCVPHFLALRSQFANYLEGNSKAM